MSRIAVIEDDPDTRLHYKKTLEKGGFEVQDFGDKESALAGLAAGGFDALVLDMELDYERHAGMEVIRQTLRQMQGDVSALCPILVVSGFQAEKYRDIALSLGVFDYLQKPVDDPSLLTKVRQLLQLAAPLERAADGEPILECGSLVLNRIRPHESTWRGERLNMPATAWLLVQELVATPGRIVTFSELFEVLKSGRNKANLQTHISTVRNAFLSVDHTFDRIVAAPGRGYIWQNEDE